MMSATNNTHTQTHRERLPYLNERHVAVSFRLQLESRRVELEAASGWRPVCGCHRRRRRRVVRYYAPVTLAGVHVLRRLHLGTTSFDKNCTRSVARWTVPPTRGFPILLGGCSSCVHAYTRGEMIPTARTEFQYQFGSVNGGHVVLAMVTMDRLTSS